MEFRNEIDLTESKNWKDIVNDFDVIEDVIIQPNGKSLRIRGTKNGKFHDNYVDYKNSKVAKEVFKKVQSFIGIKESSIEESDLTFKDAENATDILEKVIKQSKEKEIKDVIRTGMNSLSIKMKNGMVGQLTFDPTFKK